MRFSSIVALVVVTSSFALGGCAADAEPGTSAPGHTDSVTHGADLVGSDRSAELRNLGTYTQEAEAASLDGDTSLRAYEAEQARLAHVRVHGHAPAANEVGVNGPSGVVSGAELKAVVDAHTGEGNP